MSTLAPGRDQRFLIDDYEPVYVSTWRKGLLDATVETAMEELLDCKVCPRDCSVNRLLDERWQ